MQTALRGLWLVVAVEFLIGRLFTRIGIFMPKNQLVLLLYTLLADAGKIAFNLSLLAGALALAWTLWRLYADRAAGAATRLLLFPAALAALLLLLVPGSPPAPAWSLAATLLMALALGGLGLLALWRTAGGWTRLGLGGVLLAHFIWYGVAAAQIALALSGRPGEIASATVWLRYGELLAMLAPLSLALALHPFTQPAPAAGTVLGAAGAAAFGAAYLVGGDMAGVLAIWSLGFTLSWPGVLYALAMAAGIFYLVRASAGLAADRVRAIALGILWCTGYALNVNQQHLLVLLAWALMAAGPLALDAREEALP